MNATPTSLNKDYGTNVLVVGSAGCTNIW